MQQQKRKHINIPYFVPHEGCPHTCAFCSQRKITGIRCVDRVGEERERFYNTVNQSLATAQSGAFVEIAFFGGSFTGIGPDRMERLLIWAHEYIKAGSVQGIRISTRPDYIDEKILDTLKRYGVTAIELGVQSMNDSVLQACDRGHTASDTKKAAGLIRQYGFSLGCQMILGLPESDCETEITTAKEIVALGADCARIYPILVLEGTKLYEMRAQGQYAPPSIDELVLRGAKVLRIFLDSGIKVLRMGLQSSEELGRSAEYEPAYGELVWNRLYLDAMERVLQSKTVAGEEITVTVKSGDISKAAGQNKRNTEYLKKAYKLKQIKFTENSSLRTGEVIIEKRYGEVLN